MITKDHSSTFFDENIRVEMIIWLAANLDSACDALEDFFDDHSAMDMERIFGVRAAEFEPLLAASQSEEFLSFLARRKLTGFLIKASTPVPTEFGKGYVQHHGWGFYTSQWFYAEQIDDALVERLLKWKESYHAEQKKSLAAEKKKGAKKKGGAK
ncbi:MAG: hypothetical protein KF715_08465 [Candidatus Didemnitutus sp.]|nr:hypothetical protein [Candidatus Didemnitutus sp.]